MLFLYITLLGCLTLLYLWGNAACAAFRLGQPRNPFLVCWFGLFCLGVVLIPVSFCIPLNGATASGLALVGVLGVPRSLREVRVLLAGGNRRAGLIFLAGALLVVLVVAAASAYRDWPVHQYDTDLYHAQVVRWLNSYSLPWGLGNLHSRLAHGSTWLDMAALVDNGPWDGRSAWVMAGLLVCLTGLYLLHELCFSPSIWARAYALFLLPLVLFVPESTRPNLYYDTASLNLHCIVILEALYLWLQSSSERPSTDGASLLIALAALSFMIKPLTQITVIAASLFVLWWLKTRRMLAWRAVIRVWWLPAVAAVLWVGRNLVVSGWPLFPVPLCPFPFDWTMSFEAVRENYIAVRGYARMWGEYEAAMRHGITYWFPAWWDHQWGKDSFRALFLLPLALGVGGWAWALRRRRETGMILLLIWQSATLAGWFVMAPDPRFGFGFAWSFGAAGVALALRGQAWGPRVVGRWALWGCVVVVVLLGVRLGRDLAKAPHAWLLPGVIPPRPVVEHILEGGGRPFAVHVPVEGDRCGNAELPCTNAVPDNLCLRSGMMKDGFRLCPMP